MAYRTVDGFISDWAVNISRGGIFINTRTPLPWGPRFASLFRSPDTQFPFELMGRVARVNEFDNPANQVPGMGIEFVTWTTTSGAHRAFRRAASPRAARVPSAVRRRTRKSLREGRLHGSHFTRAQIERLSQLGEGVAHWDGRAVFGTGRSLATSYGDPWIGRARSFAAPWRASFRRGLGVEWRPVSCRTGAAVVTGWL